MIYPEIKSRLVLKYEAKTALSGNWANTIGFIIGFYAILIIITVILRYFPLQKEYLRLTSLLITTFLISPIVYGAFKYFWSISKGEKPQFTTLFEPFEYYGNVVKAQLIKTGIILLPVILWMLLSLFLGEFNSLHMTFKVIAEIIYFIFIIAANGILSQIEYIVNDNPTLPVIEVYKKCYGYMQDNWERYIILQLSFIGWAILAIIPCGLGLLWLIPYICVTNARFYENIKQHYDGIETIQEY